MRFKSCEHKLLILIIVITLNSLMIVGCDKSTPQKLENLRFGVGMQPSSILTFVAQEKGFFKQQGLDIELIRFPSGKRALYDGLFKGKVDAVTSSATPFVIASFKHTDMAIIATLFEANNVNRIIARRDSGITQPKDLKGRKIATQKNSAVHFFMHLFLLENGLSENDMSVSFYKAEKLPETLVSGEIDAFSMREPFIGQAKRMLGENAIIFDAPGAYRQIELLVLSRELLKTRPLVAQALLRALLQAEKFLRDEPDSAISIIAMALKSMPESVSASLQDSISHVTLEQSLISLLEDQANWARTNKIVDAKSIPNYLNFIDTKPLEKVNPAMMTLVH